MLISSNRNSINGLKWNR